MKKKGYLRFFGKHFLIWLLIAAVTGAVVTKMVRDPIVYDMTERLRYQRSHVIENTLHSLLEKTDYTPKQAVTGFIMEHGADGAYLLYDNEKQETVCDSSAILKLQFAPYGTDYISPSVFDTGTPEPVSANLGLLYIEDPDVLEKVQPFRKLYYNFQTYVKDFYVSKTDPDKVVLGEFEVCAYPPRLAGKEYSASYQTAPADPENYIHYMYVNQYSGDRNNLPEDIRLVTYISLHTVGSLPGSQALETVRNAVSDGSPDYIPSRNPFTGIWKFGDHEQYTLVYDLEIRWFDEVKLGMLAFYGILLLLAALFALLTAKIGHMRYQKNFEMDEYRRNLTATLAHDLKTPLAAIAGYAENMQENVHPEKHSAYTGAILENTQYMDRMIADVLDLAKLEDQGMLQMRDTDLMQLAHEALESRADQIAGKEITVRESGSCTALCNPKMVAQAVTNLIDNAIRYTPDGGTVEVQAENGTLTIRNSTDTPGTDNAAELAEPFAKGDPSRGNRSGSGIGLSIVRQIAALHRFRLDITNENGVFQATLSTGKKYGFLHRDLFQKK